MIVKAKPLTAEAFMPYGQVLMAKGDGPQRREFAAEMQNLRPDAKPNLTFMRVPVAQPPLLITALERHRFSNQAFVPLCGTRHLIAVCPSASDGEPELADLRAFVADGSQAVNYNADVWHAPRAALGAPGQFVMFRWDDGSPEDTETRTLAAAINVEPED
ncbi:MAG: ureidoglycolate lyase [Rhodospirillales bacterium]|nr:ureidoglycolate lyase [Rhodospirillales bacterium]